MAENKNVAWWLSWVVAPVALGASGTAAIATGTAPGITAGVGAIVGTAFVLFRRFWSK